MMDLVIFEDSIKYDLWIKVVLVLSVVLLIGLRILFHVDAREADIEHAHKAFADWKNTYPA